MEPPRPFPQRRPHQPRGFSRGPGPPAVVPAALLGSRGPPGLACPPALLPPWILAKPPATRPYFPPAGLSPLTRGSLSLPRTAPHGRAGSVAVPAPHPNAAPPPDEQAKEGRCLCPRTAFGRPCRSPEGGVQRPENGAGRAEGPASAGSPAGMSMRWKTWGPRWREAGVPAKVWGQDQHHCCGGCEGKGVLGLQAAGLSTTTGYCRLF